jgi:hypothetical protein
LEIRIITQEGTSRPSRAGKASNVVMMVVANHEESEAAKKAGKPGRGKYFLHCGCGDGVARAT